MAGITDLPQELIMMIADYLDRRQRALLASTSRSLYKSLDRCLWRTITMESDFPHYNLQHPHKVLTDIAPVRPIITPSRLQQHSHLVHTLNLRGPFRQEYYSIKYPRLHSLVLHYDTSYHAPCDKRDTCDSVLDAVMRAEEHTNGANFIRLNSTIKDLQLIVAPPQPPPEFWIAISTILTTPARLHVRGLAQTSGDILDAFWKACDLFEEIDIRDTTYMRLPPILKELSFSRLKRISLDLTRPLGFDTGHQLAWLRRCPNLTRINWRFASYESSMDKFAEALEQNVWPRLEDLGLEWLDEEDEMLARRLAHLPPLRRFQLRSSKLGPLTAGTLRERLYDNVRVLDMARSPRFTSQMALGVLESCVHLEEFRTFFICADDIDLKARPWACLGLKRLKSIIWCKSDVTDDKAFEALSRLINLEYLDVGHKNMGIADVRYFAYSFSVPPAFVDHDDGSWSLRWKLERGLGRLATLKKLRSLSLEGTEQRLAEEDVKWMVSNWLMLDEVRGLGDMKVEQTALNILQMAEILYKRPYPAV
ncbi:hypothetical protein K457DRAFT_142766 [Linnemannia elongata AG-77]|uniref:F-box domain-containing protein n=1 Tax=Linnemannia elongata AG-77 TaxID=1314771 RepID=A0A197JE33_9FUNG|nr:hypothetical protein K457DRAFT_142766 [Linnemannia elongata AG-77]